MKKLTSAAGTEYVYKGQSIWLNEGVPRHEKYSVYIKEEVLSARVENLGKAKDYITFRLAAK